MNDNDQFESLACNCVEVGTIIKEDDTVLTISLSGPDADSQLDKLKKEAKKIAQDTCKISSNTIEENNQRVIRATFNFDCTAEKLIFQMKTA